VEALKWTQTQLRAIQHERARALMVEIALAVGSDEEREAAECDEVEEFDPWAALRRFRERDEQRTVDAEIVGTLHGELAGLRVSESFFRNRCEMLEVATRRALTNREQESFAGCCPLCSTRMGNRV
jgi:hypothetical protein